MSSNKNVLNNWLKILETCTLQAMTLQYLQEKAQKYFKNFEEKIKEQHVVTVEIMEYLSGELSENILLKTQKEILHIHKYYSFDLPSSAALFHHKGN